MHSGGNGRPHHCLGEDSHHRHRRWCGCDGQVLVLHDLLGLSPGYVPRHVKAYANLKEIVVESAWRFRDEVREGKFPGKEQAFS